MDLLDLPCDATKAGNKIQYKIHNKSCIMRVVGSNPSKLQLIHR